MAPKQLLTDDELESLTMMADAVRAIAGSDLPQGSGKLSDQIERLRELVDDSEDHVQILELAEDLDSGDLLDWIKALDDGERVIDKLVLKLADKDDEDGEEDEDEPGPP
jgi:hypothetical protein